jgi:hypothetical protein
MENIKFEKPDMKQSFDPIISKKDLPENSILKGKPPDSTQAIILLSIVIYFFTKDFVLLFSIVSILLLIKQIYKDGYTLQTFNKWINFKFTSITKSNDKHDN